jgi:diaminopimelate epimerase
MQESLQLVKYHGLGNDYLVLDPNKNEIRLQERHIIRLCRRNIGVGADGILYGPLMQNGKIYVQIFNPDGSEAERSGNGVRIFAKYLLDEHYVERQEFTLSTKAGDVTIDFLNQEGSRMRVNMGKAQFSGGVIRTLYSEDEIVNEPLIFHEQLYNATCVSMGNPNCVIMMEEVSAGKAKELGPYVENAAYFPNRINMQLCHVMDRSHVQVEIYERGAGYTLASGTGACAAATAAYRLGLVDGKVFVKMPGGELVIEIMDDLTVYLTGDVEKIGTFLLAENFFA